VERVGSIFPSSWPMDYLEGQQWYLGKTRRRSMGGCGWKLFFFLSLESSKNFSNGMLLLESSICWTTRGLGGVEKKLALCRGVRFTCRYG
jgi:hypothetical protein